MRWSRGARLVAAAFLAAAGAVGLAAPAHAEQINRFTVEARVDADSSLHLVETITYDFQGEYRHGIFRDIPLYDDLGLGKRREYGIEVGAVTMDGQAVPVFESDVDAFRRLQIGHPNRTITGPHTYVIEYTVRDALRVITPADVDDPAFPAGVEPGDVELYWDFVGSGWKVPIAAALTRVSGPGAVLSARCYFGPADGTEQCRAEVDQDRARLGPVSLWPGEALTGAITFPASAFIAAPRENVRQGLPSDPLTGVGLALLPAAVIVAVPAAYAASHRRRDRGAPVPGAPAQYGPPDDLAPAEMFAAWRGPAAAADSRVVLATLLDLAARGWITVSSPDSKHLTVSWLGTGAPARRPWEERLLGLVLKGKTSASLTQYDSRLASGWKDTYRQLLAAQESAGRRNPTGDEPDRRWRALGLASVLAAVAAFVSLFVGQPFITAVLFTLAGAGIVSFAVARTITPRRETAQSAMFMAKVAGLRKVLDSDPAAARREFAQQSGLSPAAVFATMLPFAVVLSLEKSWIGAFPDLTPDDLARSGYQVSSIGAMDSFIATSSASMSSATTAPSSSSGSGSGGGGSSGGGGGGGGGGSW